MKYILLLLLFGCSDEILNPVNHKLGFIDYSRCGIDESSVRKYMYGDITASPNGAPWMIDCTTNPPTLYHKDTMSNIWIKEQAK